MSVTDVSRRRQRVGELSASGLRVPQIARTLRVSCGLVGNDLHGCRGGRGFASPEKPPAAREVDRTQMSGAAGDLADIERIEQAAWSEWEASCRPRETTTRKVTVDRGGEKVVETMRRTPGRGDARFLTLALKCLVKRREWRADLEREQAAAREADLQALIDDLPAEQHDTINQAGALIEDLMAKASAGRGTGETESLPRTGSPWSREPQEPRHWGSSAFGRGA